MQKRKIFGFIMIGAVIFLLLSCDGSPFGSSDNGSPRFSPDIDNLDLSRSTVFCDMEFTISFDYEDPQDDISFIALLFIGNQEAGIIEECIDWEDDRVDLESEDGRAIVTYNISCDLDVPEDDYTLRVMVEDERNHESDELATEISLL